MANTRINLCDVALAYAARGWSVIPLWPEGKTPLLPKEHPWSLYQSRIATPEEIRAWWQKWPDANIGIVTGAVSNLGVIDMDGQEGIENAKALDLPPTLTVKTGGDGLHAYYSHPGVEIRNIQDSNKLAEKVDFRGDGGYVVAPCSLHESGRYYTFVGGFGMFRANPAPFPKNVLDLLSSEKKVEGGWEQVKSQEPWVTQLLQGVGEGERHSALVRLSGFFNSKGMPIDVTKTLLLEWNSRNSPPYPTEKIGTTVEDIYKRYPAGAKEDEIRPNNVPAVSHKGQQVSVTSAKDAFASFKASLEERKKFKGAELSTGFPVLDGFTNGLARANLAVVGAWPGVGKTAWMLGVVKHLAESGHKVAYFPTEMSKNEVLKVLVSNGLSIPFDRVFKGEIDDDEMNRIERYMTGELLKNLEICEIDRPSIKDIEKTCEALKPDVFMLDYVQHTQVGSAQREGIQEMVYGLKSLAKKLNAAALVSSQFRRPYKNDEGQPCPPTMFDFAECGQIEREVSFALLMSPTKERFEADLTYPVHFSLAKNRFGKVAEFDLSFSQSYVRFTQ